MRTVLAALNAAVHSALARFDYVSAAFLAERLVAVARTEASARGAGARPDETADEVHARALLGLVYYRSGKPQKAAALLRGCTDDEGRYLLAFCLFEQDRFNDAEAVLLPDIPNGAAGLHLMGQICRRTARPDAAAEYHRRALQRDPMLWSSLQALCELGVRVDPAAIFSPDAPYWEATLCGTDDADGAAQTPAEAGVAALASAQARRALGAPSSAATDAAFVTPTARDVGDSRRVPPPTRCGVVEQGATESPPAVAQLRPPSAPAPPSSVADRTASKRSVRPARLLFSTPSLEQDESADRHDDEDAPPAVASGASASAAAAAAAAATASARRRSSRLSKRKASGEFDADAAPGDESYVTPAAPHVRGTSGPAVQARGADSIRGAPRGRRQPAHHGLGTPTPGASFAATSGAGAGAAAAAAAAGAGTTAGVAASENENLQQLRDDVLSPIPMAASFSEAASTHGKARHNADEAPAGARTLGEERRAVTRGGGAPKARGGRMVTFETPEPRQRLVRGAALRESVAEMCQWMAQFASAYSLQCAYDLAEALKVYDALPLEHRSSGWVLTQTARCYFELANYSKAAEFYRFAFDREPYRLEGLEYFSTCLWHMKEEVELAHLAHRVCEQDRLSPHAWMVVGNCFSLQKDNDSALKFFQRALQLDPHMAYAYTLCGHEYVATEDYEKATTAYRKALTVDQRHYNAWFGLGNICFKQEKLDVAAYHFRRAISINSRSSVLFCFLGIVLNAAEQHDEALRVLEQAAALDPLNPQARFQKANVLFTQERYEEALEVLRELRDAVPRERAVHFLMGRVYKRLRQPDQAIACFTTAMDLDPKDRTTVKNAIDRLHKLGPDANSDDEYA